MLPLHNFILLRKKKCKLCGCFLAYDHTEAKFCHPCQQKLEELGLTAASTSPQFYTTQEYAHEYRLSVEEARRMCRNKEIRCIKVGQRGWHIPKSGLKLTAIPRGMKSSLRTAAGLLRSFDEVYSIREMFSDLDQHGIANVIQKARQRQPPPEGVIREAMRLIQELPPPDELVHGLEAFIME